MLPPVNKNLEAVNCPLALTWKLLADIISSVGVIEDERTKLLLDILLAPIINPPILPPLKCTSEPEMIPLDDKIKAPLELDIEVLFIANPPIVRDVDFSTPAVVTLNGASANVA